MRIDMIHRRVRCTGFVKLYAALSIGSADSLALAGGRSHDANPNNHAFVHGILTYTVTTNAYKVTECIDRVRNSRRKFGLLLVVLF